MTNSSSNSIISKIVEKFLSSNFSIILIIAALIAGISAILITPREEEPQIVVPLADVIVSVPGASAKEVEKTVSSRLEKLLWQIDGVEYVYSMSKPGVSIVTVRFYVGEDREKSLVELYNKIEQNIDIVPPNVAGWVVKPVDINDVPIVCFTLYSFEDVSRFQLHRIAEELVDRLQEIKNTARTTIIGGTGRHMLIYLDPQKLKSYGLSILDIKKAIEISNASVVAGKIQNNNRENSVRAGTFYTSSLDLSNLVVGVSNDQPIYLNNVAKIIDGPDEDNDYTWIQFGHKNNSEASIHNSHKLIPAVTIAIAKKKGTNAVTVAKNLIAKVKELKKDVIPDNIKIVVTRNYGETANDKINDLLEALLVAVISVIALIWILLGWREGIIVALTIPITYSLTLIINYLIGYTINRVTLFALILSLGLLVDDPIVDVENIYRHMSMKIRPPKESVLVAVNEVRPPIIMATLAVIVSFLPLFFITGLMGPYMRPMAFNVPIAMLMSIVVAFTITPWLAYKFLSKAYEKNKKEEEIDLHSTLFYRIYTKIISPFLLSRKKSLFLIFFMILLILISALLPLSGLVPLKMLPFDNKNELQLMIDMPEGTPLEETNRAVIELSNYLHNVPEVKDLESYVGISSPMDFNGLVRHYYMRNAPNLADIRINLISKYERKIQSHEIALKIRNALEKIAEKWNADIKIVEIPPGPPVFSTIVGEIYGTATTSYNQLISYTKKLEKLFTRINGLKDIDSILEDKQKEYIFHVDRKKAALNGISQLQIVNTLKTALNGLSAGIIHIKSEHNPVIIKLRVSKSLRSHLTQLESIYVRNRNGHLIPLGELGNFIEDKVDQTIYHKNLKPVSYVFGEAVGISPVNIILKLILSVKKEKPPKNIKVVWNGEGEWKITLDVFRDLGIGFAGALAGIYLLLVIETSSFIMPLIIMISIPFTLIGILPGFFILNLIANKPVSGYDNPVFFSATAMIGMIALSGIVVRNAIILIDFIRNSIKEGKELRIALLESGAVRFRPILLTAGTSLLGNVVITLDPIFSGLAWSIIFGIFASTIFTMLFIPIVFNLIYGEKSVKTEK